MKKGEDRQRNQKERLKKRGEELPPFNYRFIKIVPQKMRMLDLREGIYNVTWTK